MFAGKPVWVALILLLAGWVYGAGGSDSVDQAVRQRALELVAGKTTRFDKLVALQLFVRDEIAQANTEYG